LKTKNSEHAVRRIVFAAAVSIRDVQSLIAHINHNPDDFSSGFFVFKKARMYVSCFLKIKNSKHTVCRIVFAAAVLIRGCVIP
jgi:hypothetical protein